MQIPLLPEHLAAIEAVKRRSGSTNTQRAYDGAWSGFLRWCESYGYPPLPADPGVAAAYLASRALEGRKLATIRKDRIALSTKHKAAGLPNPVDSEEVKKVMSDLNDYLGAEQKQARPLDEAAFDAIRRSAAIPRRRPDGGREGLDDALERGAQDIAIISVMRNALLRAGEAAALVWADVRPQADGTGQVYIRRSKTDQRAVGTLRHLGRRTMSDLEEIRPFDERGQTVFGLNAQGVSRRIKAAAQAAGLGDGFSGHSPRVGMAVDLATFGSGLPELQHAGGWTTMEQVMRYIRPITAAQGVVARYEVFRESGAGDGLQEAFARETDKSYFLFNDD